MHVNAKVGVKLVGPYFVKFILSARNLSRHFPANCGHLSLKVTQTGLASVITNDSFYTVVGKLDMFFRDAVRFNLARDNIFFGYLKFFVLRVTGKTQYFHPVEQWHRDCVHHIGGGYEHDVCKVKRHAKIMIHKRVVLLRVKHFQQGGTWVSSKIRAELVYFIHHENRVIGAGLFQSLYDTPR